MERARHQTHNGCSKENTDRSFYKSGFEDGAYLLSLGCVGLSFSMGFWGFGMGEDNFKIVELN